MHQKHFLQVIGMSLLYDSHVHFLQTLHILAVLFPLHSIAGGFFYHAVPQQQQLELQHFNCQHKFHPPVA